MYKHKCTALTKFQVKRGAFIYRDKFYRELRKSVLWQKLLEINTYKNIMELFFFKKPLHLRLLRHRKRTVTLYQNYGSSLVRVTGHILLRNLPCLPTQAYGFGTGLRTIVLQNLPPATFV